MYLNELYVLLVLAFINVVLQLRKFSSTKKRRNSGSRLNTGDLTVDNAAYNDALFGDDDTDVDRPSFDHAIAEGSLMVRD